MVPRTIRDAITREWPNRDPDTSREDAVTPSAQRVALLLGRARLTVVREALVAHTDRDRGETLRHLRTSEAGGAWPLEAILVLVRDRRVPDARGDRRQADGHLGTYETRRTAPVEAILVFACVRLIRNTDRRDRKALGTGGADETGCTGSRLRRAIGIG